MNIGRKEAILLLQMIQLYMWKAQENQWEQVLVLLERIEESSNVTGYKVYETALIKS